MLQRQCADSSTDSVACANISHGRSVPHCRIALPQAVRSGKGEHRVSTGGGGVRVLRWRGPSSHRRLHRAGVCVPECSTATWWRVSVVAMWWQWSESGVWRGLTSCSLPCVLSFVRRRHWRSADSVSIGRLPSARCRLRTPVHGGSPSTPSSDL